MSILANITTGRDNRPPRLMIYGQEGVGKARSVQTRRIRFSFKQRTAWEKSTAQSSLWQKAWQKLPVRFRLSSKKNTRIKPL